MNPEDFRSAWIAMGDELVAFPEARIVNLRIPEEDRAFLISPGLPRDAAPFLSFGSQQGLFLPSVSQIWRQPESFERFKIIGSNGFGDPVCVDESTDGSVVYLNHDNEFRADFMNSSVPQLAYTTLAFRDAVRQTRDMNGEDAFLNGEIPSAVVDEFITKIESIDPAGIADGTFWFHSILGEGI